MNGHDQGNGLVSSQAVNQSTSPPLYGQAMINGYPLSGMIINKPETWNLKKVKNKYKIVIDPSFILDS